MSESDHAPAEIEARIRRADRNLDDLYHKLHLLERVEQEHGDELPDDRREQLRDHIEDARIRLWDSRRKVDRLKARVGIDDAGDE